MPDGIGTHLVHQDAQSRSGRLELEFRRGPDDKTFVGRQFSSYPFHICRPFHLDHGPCAGLATVYTQSCSGGIYGLDRLATTVTVRKHAQAQVTTQAATIVHRATHGLAEQNCSLVAEEGALLEYLPDTTILFPGAELKSRLRLTLAESAGAILCDSFLAHDHEGGTALFEMFDNTVLIERPDGRPIAIERFRISGRDFVDGGIGISGGYACHGSILAITPGCEPDALIGDLRRASSDLADCVLGLSRLPGAPGLSARILARDAVALRRAMLRLWEGARWAMTGCAPGPRRK